MLILLPTRVAPSAIPDAGLGLFAVHPIARGTVVAKRCPLLEISLTLEQLLELPETFQEYMWTHSLFDPSIEKFTTTTGNALFMNHSFEPNCHFVFSSTDDGELLASRAIASGEEITFDYRALEVPTDFASRPPSFAETFTQLANNSLTRAG